jgi:hypothetical protein
MRYHSSKAEAIMDIHYILNVNNNFIDHVEPNEIINCMLIIIAKDKLIICNDLFLNLDINNEEKIEELYDLVSDLTELSNKISNSEEFIYSPYLMKDQSSI